MNVTGGLTGLTDLTVTMRSATTSILTEMSSRLDQELEEYHQQSSNDVSDVSPVTGSSEMSRVARLLMLASCAVVGSVGNVFMISAIMVEDHLKKRGNAFLVNVALADLLISGMVIPASAVLILAGMHDPEYVPQGICSFEWTLEALCFLVTVLTLAVISVENYMRLCWPIERYSAVTTRKVTFGVLAIWVVASVAVGLQSYLELGPNLCTIKGKRAFTMSTSTGGIVSASIIVGAPMLFTILVFGSLVLRVRSAMKSSYKPPVAFSWDYELTKANIYSFFFFGIFWLPLGVTFCVSGVKPVSPKTVVNLAWFALSKSCFNNLLYCVADRHFRSAYIKLFDYCCCKTTVSFSRRTRAGGAASSSGDVKLTRVHIIHSYAPAAAGRPTSHCGGSGGNGGRDVYEL